MKLLLGVSWLDTVFREIRFLGFLFQLHQHLLCNVTYLLIWRHQIQDLRHFKAQWIQSTIPTHIKEDDSRFCIFTTFKKAEFPKIITQSLFLHQALILIILGYLVIIHIRPLLTASEVSASVRGPHHAFGCASVLNVQLSSSSSEGLSTSTPLS